MSGIHLSCEVARYVFLSVEYLFGVAYVNGNFDDESAKVEGSFNIR